MSEDRCQDGEVLLVRLAREDGSGLPDGDHSRNDEVRSAREDGCDLPDEDHSHSDEGRPAREDGFDLEGLRGGGDHPVRRNDREVRGPAADPAPSLGVGRGRRPWRSSA